MWRAPFHFVLGLIVGIVSFFLLTISLIVWIIIFIFDENSIIHVRDLSKSVSGGLKSKPALLGHEIGFYLVPLAELAYLLLLFG